MFASPAADVGASYLTLLRTTQAIAWMSAVASQDVSPDEGARSIVAACAGPSSHPGGVTVGGASLTWPDFLTRFVAEPDPVCQLRIPRTGDSRGLTGQWLDYALTAGCLIALRGPFSAILVAPSRSSSSQWHLDDNRPHDLMSTGDLPVESADQADRGLKRAVLVAAENLDVIDLHPSDPQARAGIEQVRDQFTHIDWPANLTMADGLGRIPIDLALRGVTMMAAVTHALSHTLTNDGPAISAHESTVRARTLLDLDLAARRCVEAAFTRESLRNPPEVS
ncbi:MAG: hypothetical protein WAO41_03470 [Candidatus Nanopelagicales bacterium]